MTKKKIFKIASIVSIVMFCLTYFTYWLGGGNFNRGDSLAMTFVASLIVVMFFFFAILTCPYLDD